MCVCVFKPVEKMLNHQRFATKKTKKQEEIKKKDEEKKIWTKDACRMAVATFEIRS